MEIKRLISFPYIKKMVTFVKPIEDELGNSVRNMYISDDCKLYDKDEWDSKDYASECNESTLRVNIDSHGRKYAAINDNSANHKRTQHLARLCRRAFDNPKHDDEFYKTHQVDHINPSIPLDNSIYNLEWVSNKENMYRAGKTGVMEKKYSRETVRTVCEKLSNGENRTEIAKELNVDIHLIDDILSGKSHKSISQEYLNKGFKYRDKRYYNRKEKEIIVHQVCKILESNPNMKCQEIANLVENKITYKDVSNIRRGFTYRYISINYNIDINKYKRKNE